MTLTIRRYSADDFGRGHIAHNWSWHTCWAPVIEAMKASFAGTTSWICKNRGLHCIITKRTSLTAAHKKLTGLDVRSPGDSKRASQADTPDTAID